jgi:hypothetical protein
MYHVKEKKSSLSLQRANLEETPGPLAFIQNLWIRE